jgi:pimeloyl-ACP methyl ester carboxylesterase
MASIKRRDFTLRSAEGVEVAIREVRPTHFVEDRVPLILTAGPDADESDLLAEDLARAGHDCFVVDTDGFGCGERRSALGRSASSPLLRGMEIARDLDAAAGALRAATGATKIGIFQRGAPIGLIYAALWPERVSHLVLCNGSAPCCDEGMIDAADIYCRVMIIDTDRDSMALREDLVRAQEVRVWQPKRAGQDIFLDWPDLGRNEGMQHLLTFLQ